MGTSTSFALTVDKSNLCYGDSAYLCAVSGYTSYQWSNNASGVCIYVTQSGTYTVTASGAGCTATSTPSSIVVYAANPATYLASGAVLTAAGGTRYQWYLNGIPISGATTQVWTATTSGNYSVEITDANGCTTTSSPRFVIATGIAQISGEIEFSIYPNPAKSGITVYLPSLSSDATISLKDVLGQDLTTLSVTSSRMAFDLTQYVEGVYFVEVAQGGIRAIRKLIINR